MDLVNAVWTFLTESVLPFLPYLWPFFTVAIASAVVGQVFARNVWTVRNAQKSKFIDFGRSTIPLHPLVVCGSLGLVWRNPCGDVWGPDESVAYFGMAGFVSYAGYWLLDLWLEKRGIDLDRMFEPPKYLATPDSRDTDPDAKDAPSSELRAPRPSSDGSRTP